MNPLIVLAAIEAAQKLIEFIIQAVREAKRTQEWTPEQEAEIDRRMREAFLSDHWTT